ncbi:membrane protein [Mesocricetibacter intestinalis]|uniref:Membrane protein n=1 Tax=Mesocricetibacter intestinalis TaxID=1521930 RepID=A0A4R6VBH8_9PAST|nr:YtjB family periplasmic protein [Mesocricetibacter intestinalis]TDQ59628.1 membrane protein [Mesocricetibacter intestinalis]
MHLIIKEKIAKTAMFIAIAALCIGVLAVILFGINQFKIGSQIASVNQVSNLSHLLVRQQANIFSILLSNRADTEKLNENLAALTKEQFILDASIYAENGALLAQTNNMPELRRQLGLDKSELSGEEDFRSRQIVEPIYSANGLEGFLRVTFDAGYGQTTQNKINQIFHRLYGELLIVFLIGILLASSTHYFLSHYRRARRKQKEIQPVLKTENLAPVNNALNFHRRRRRFRSH